MKKLNELTLSKKKSDFEIKTITGCDDSVNYIRQFYSDDIGIYESFFLLLLNRANKTIGYAKISQGGICGTVCDPIIIAKYAIDSLACAVILCHNHPSGNTQPSIADKQVTEQVKNGLKLFNVKVLDHIILTEDSFLSFSEEGIL